ncbi:unnamed protein product [Caretta caretta]
MEFLSQIKRKKKRMQDDMFSKILQARAESDYEHRIWWMNIEGSLEKERVERRESQQEKEKEMHPGYNGVSQILAEIIQQFWPEYLIGISILAYSQTYTPQVTTIRFKELTDWGLGMVVVS